MLTRRLPAQTVRRMITHALWPLSGTCTFLSISWSNVKFLWNFEFLFCYLAAWHKVEQNKCKHDRQLSYNNKIRHLIFRNPTMAATPLWSRPELYTSRLACSDEAWWGNLTNGIISNIAVEGQACAHHVSYDKNVEPIYDMAWWQNIALSCSAQQKGNYGHGWPIYNISLQSSAIDDCIF